MKLNKSSKFGAVGAAGVLVLCVLGALLYFGGWDRETSDPRGSRYEWLLDPVEERFPPADQALELPGFRVAGVHYWQGNWNFNFWTNLKVHWIDEDFRRIREHGFNTMLLNISWGYFQTKAFPPAYDERAFQKLAVLLEAAARHHLYVILRVGTHDELPEGIRGRPYFAPYLLVDDRALPAYCDLFRETARRVAGGDNVLFLFFSWEDLWGHVEVSMQDWDYRLDFMRGADAFRRHLSRKELSHWNQRWHTSYQSLEEIPFPQYGSPAYGDFFEFADQRLLEVVLPAVAAAARQGSPDVRLSYEIRVDAEPIWSPGSHSITDWLDHRRTWNLTADYPIVTAYFNPSWGALPEGGFISTGEAVERLDFLLAAMEESISGKPVFFDQLNFTDSTPWLQPYSPRLEAEEDIARFLELSLDRVRKRSLGYAVWAFQALEINSLYNSSFEDGLRGWQVADPERVRVEEDPERRERFLTLEPAGVIHQESRLLSYPEPFDLRLMARSEAGGRLLIRFETADQTGWQTLAREELSPTAAWGEYQLQFPTAKDYRLRLESTGTRAVEVDDLSLFQYAQTASVLGREGEVLGRRSEVLRRINRSWRLASGKVGLESPWTWSREELIRAEYAHPDGWAPQEVVVPLLIPWFDAALLLEFYLPENELGAAGSSVQIDLGGRSLGQHTLKPGANRLYLPLSEPLYPGRWMLRLRFGRALRPRDHDPSSDDERTLGAVPLIIQAVKHGPENQHWRTEVSPTESRRHVEAVVRLINWRGSPLKDTLVLGHAGSHVEAGKSDRNGRAVLKLELERKEGRPTPIFIEVLDSSARIESVEIQ